MSIVYIGEVYYCDRWRQVTWLEKNGFHFFGTRPDFKELSRNVWMYRVDDEFIDCLNEQQERLGTHTRYARK